jgi:hypothetical protein
MRSFPLKCGVLIEASQSDLSNSEQLPFKLGCNATIHQGLMLWHFLKGSTLTMRLVRSIQRS